MTLDLICHVVDNYGDIAVVWRLARALVEDSGGRWTVRLLVDDWAAFRALNPAVDPASDVQVFEVPGGTVTAVQIPALDRLEFYKTQPADVLVEAFGAPTPVVCLEAFFVAAQQPGALRQRVIIHLEYLTAEAWSESYHMLPSPIGRPGVERRFFVPGFRERTGGLVFVDEPVSMGVDAPVEKATEDLVITVFSYEHNFDHFWQDVADHRLATGESVRVRVFEGRPKAGLLASRERIRRTAPMLNEVVLEELPFVDQDTYTALVNASDFNIVRGEESWVVAVLSGKPFLWHAYLQDEAHQLVKVDAFLEVMQPWYAQEGPESLDVFEKVAKEFRAFNDRHENSAEVLPQEHYRVFWQNRALIGRVQSRWAAELRKSAKLSRRLLDFLDTFKV